MRPAGRSSWPVAVFACAAVSASCAQAPSGPPPVTISIATGGIGGIYNSMGTTLAQIYSERVAGIRAEPQVATRTYADPIPRPSGEAQVTTGSLSNVLALQRGDAQIGFAQGDVAYLAHKQGTDIARYPHTHLRAIAVLFVNAAQVVTPRDGPIRSIADLKGRRVGVGVPDSNTELAARTILESYGFGYEDLEARFLDIDEVLRQLEIGQLDAGFIATGYPASALIDISTRVPLRLLPVGAREVKTIRTRNPFFKAVTVPRGTYPDQDADVPTIGKDSLLLCRDDLPMDLVFELTKVLFESFPQLKVSAELIDPEDAPATSVPLHLGAARYYRQRELLRWFWSLE
jgi:TRAP transporter TAXI family solute receptor